jgi:hypothetical protein
MAVGAENEHPSEGLSSPMGLPKAGPLGKAPAAPIEPDNDTTEAERNTIFDSLVRVEGEVPGLVAYSIYKQNKRAWLNDFLKATGRPPTEAESRAYIIGESTERRMATYRHLAAATLAGQGPEAPAASGRSSVRPPASRSGSYYLISAVVLILALALLAFALRFGFGVGAPLGK